MKAKLPPATPGALRKVAGTFKLRVLLFLLVMVCGQKLRATLMFHTVEPGKASRSEQIAVDFQLVITGHDTKVEESDWRFGSQVGRHMKDVALAPLAPFQLLLFVIVCSTSTCDI